MYECVYVHVCCKNLSVTWKWETQAPDRWWVLFAWGMEEPFGREFISAWSGLRALDIKEKKNNSTLNIVIIMTQISSEQEAFE